MSRGKKFGRIISWRPLLWVGSWIRHWNGHWTSIFSVCLWRTWLQEFGLDSNRKIGGLLAVQMAVCTSRTFRVGDRHNLCLQQQSGRVNFTNKTSLFYYTFWSTAFVYRGSTILSLNSLSSFCSKWKNAVNSRVFLGKWAWKINFISENQSIHLVHFHEHPIISEVLSDH